MAGDAAKHDQLVGDVLRNLSKKVDVILLAQAPWQGSRYFG